MDAWSVLACGNVKKYGVGRAGNVCPSFHVSSPFVSHNGHCWGLFFSFWLFHYRFVLSVVSNQKVGVTPRRAAHTLWWCYGDVTSCSRTSEKAEQQENKWNHPGREIGALRNRSRCRPFSSVGRGYAAISHINYRTPHIHHRYVITRRFSVVKQIANSSGSVV